MTLDEIRAFLMSASEDERRAVFEMLRKDFGLIVHPLEQKWHTTAEAILEAIDKSGDLTQRGVRGVLAEAIFRTVVVPQKLALWSDTPPVGDVAYDLLLHDGSRRPALRVQVKLQRRLRGQPMHYRRKTGVYVVETQRTRTGTRRHVGSVKDEVAPAESAAPLLAATRPYRVDEFDVLAVCLQPSTGNWEDFIYCATKDLKTRPGDHRLLEVLQPIYPDEASSGWTRSFDRAATRARDISI